MNWDNVRVFTAVAEHGSIAKAASALAINHTTVLRRLAALEDELGLKLFNRSQSGYRLTAQGEQILDVALIMQEDATALIRKAQGIENEQQGPLKVSIPSNNMIDFAGLFAAFNQAHPDILLNIDARSIFTDLDKGDAHVSLRLTNNPPEHYVGKKLLTIPYALFGEKNYLAQKRPITRFSDLDWIIWSIPTTETAHADGDHNAMKAWLLAEDPNTHIVMQTNAQNLIHDSVAKGVGVSHLPVAIGQQSEHLERVTELECDFTMDLWILMHSDLRFQHKVRRFRQFVQEYVETHYL